MPKGRHLARTKTDKREQRPGRRRIPLSYGSPCPETHLTLGAQILVGQWTAQTVLKPRYQGGTQGLKETTTPPENADNERPGNSIIKAGVNHD